MSGKSQSDCALCHVRALAMLLALTLMPVFGIVWGETRMTFFHLLYRINCLADSYAAHNLIQLSMGVGDHISVRFEESDGCPPE